MTNKLKLQPGVYGIRQGDGNDEDEVTIVEEEQVEEEQLDDEQTDETIDVDDDESEAEEEDSKEPDETEEQRVDDDEGEVIITIGDEEPTPEKEEQAPEWVRELRKSHREMARENRELKEKLRAKDAPEQQAVQLGKKPSLEDYDYDTEKYEQELAAWYERKRQVDEQAAQAETEAKAAEEAWQGRLTAYGEAKSKLKVKDFDDAEEVVLNSMSQTQQGIIIQGADNAALVIYALGKNDNKAKELASIKDPVKFAFAVAKLEKDLKVRNRKAPPPPEKKVSGTAPKSGSVDSTLERLRSEAERTGNYSKVHRYKQQLRAKGKKK